MNINELIYFITKRERQYTEETLSAPMVFMENFYYRFRSGQSEAAGVFYDSPYDPLPWNETQNTFWEKFITRYTCYMLSKYNGMNLPNAVRSNDFDTIMDTFKASDNHVPHFTIPVPETFEALALDGYLRLNPGIQAFIKSDEYIQVLGLKSWFDVHKARVGSEVLQVLLFLAKYSGKQDEVLTKWKTYDERFCTQYDIAKYLDYHWFTFLIYDNLQTGKVIFNTLNPYVTKCCDQTRVVQRMGTVTSYTSQSASSYKEEFTDTYRGENACKWLESVGKNFLKDTVICFTTTQPGKGDDSGCVIEGTHIIMADLSLKAVEAVGYKDQVMSCALRPSHCSEEHILNYNVKNLYAVNGDKPFMSLEHAILTNRGWCAPCPESANSINPDHDVKQLLIGDIFYKYAVENGELISREVTVEEITIEKNQKTCHDLHFYFGEQSYIANGYPCLLNYPPLTMASIRKKLTPQLIAESLPLLKAVLGEAQTRLLQEANEYELG